MRSSLKSKSWCAALSGAALTLLMTAASGEAAAAGTFITAAGARVPMPDIVSLDCEQMVEVLAAIDASGYRGAARRPHDEADAPLLEYENRLALTHFQRCASIGRGTAPESAFAGGYDN